MQNLHKGQSVIILTDAVHQKTQKSLNGRRGRIVEINNDNEIIVAGNNFKLPSSKDEVKPYKAIYN